MYSLVEIERLDTELNGVHAITISLRLLLVTASQRSSLDQHHSTGQPLHYIMQREHNGCLPTSREAYLAFTWTCIPVCLLNQ